MRKLLRTYYVSTLRFQCLFKVTFIGIKVITLKINAKLLGIRRIVLLKQEVVDLIHKSFLLLHLLLCLIILEFKLIVVMNCTLIFLLTHSFEQHCLLILQSFSRLINAMLCHEGILITKSVS